MRLLNLEPVHCGLFLPLAGLLIVAGCSDDGLAPQSTATEGDTAAETASTAGSGSSDSDSGQSASGTDSGDTAASTSGSSDGTGGSTAGPTDTDTDTDTDGTGTTGEVPPTACESNEDCMVVDDCCSCTAIHNDDTAPMCEVEECAQSTCSMYEVSTPAAVCRFGTCELEPVDCNALLVSCDSLPPECDPGFLPSVSEGCWTNVCVPAELCNVVSQCGDCSDDETCVTRVTQVGNEFICEPIAPDCAGVPACDCMDPCEDPYVCSDAGDPGTELACNCPTC